jgi:glutamate racemase
MIGIFDSTIGGLAIAKAFEQLLPRHSLLYLGDIARAPYYRKTAADIVQYSIENTQFLIERGAEIVVIGCNSAASVATEIIQQTFDIPVFDIITPAVQEAVRLSERQRIGIIGTRATINRNLYSDAVTGSQPECRVFPKACPLLVPLVEEGWVRKKETKMILKKYLYSLKNQQLDALILSCTHYSLLKELVQFRIGRKVTLIDPSVEVAVHVKRYLDGMPDLLKSEKISQVKRHYLVTGLTETTENVASQILKRPTQLQLT